MADGGVAHTGCVGFGLERITLALFRTHGLDLAPMAGSEVRRELWPMRPRRPGDGQPASGTIRRRTGPIAIHAGERTYMETNCFTDIIDRAAPRPRRRAGRGVRLDSSGWTSRVTSGRSSSRCAVDMERLFGIDIHEMQPYRSIPGRSRRCIALGRTMTIELDAWYLPTRRPRATAPRTSRRGSSPKAIDVDGQRFRYFHNAVAVRAARRGLPGRLPARRRTGRTTSSRHTRSWSASTPGPRCGARNCDESRARSCAVISTGCPRQSVRALRRAARRDLPRLLAGDEAIYHAYAFATFRMAGAGFELLASHVDWLLGRGGSRAVRSWGDRRRLQGAWLQARTAAAFDPTDGDARTERRLDRGDGRARRTPFADAVWTRSRHPPTSGSMARHPVVARCRLAGGGHRSRMRDRRRTDWTTCPGCRPRSPGPPPASYAMPGRSPARPRCGGLVVPDDVRRRPRRAG